MERKRPKGNDATQDLSLSDLIVPGKPPTKPPTIAPRGSASAKNDMSLWGGVVLGTQDFAPPVAPKRNPKKWIIAGVAGAALVAVVLYFVFHTTDAKKSDSVADTKVEAPQPPKPDVETKPDVKAAAATSGSSAGSATASGSSSAASGSAANTTAAGSGASTSAGAAVPALMANGKEVDAISGVASVIRAKKAPARKAVKKTTAKAKAPVKKAPIKKKKR
jgi:hypothetical protein